MLSMGLEVSVPVRSCVQPAFLIVNFFQWTIGSPFLLHATSLYRLVINASSCPENRGYKARNPHLSGKLRRHRWVRWSCAGESSNWAHSNNTSRPESCSKKWNSDGPRIWPPLLRPLVGEFPFRWFPGFKTVIEGKFWQAGFRCTAGLLSGRRVRMFPSFPTRDPCGQVFLSQLHRSAPTDGGIAEAGETLLVFQHWPLG